MKSHNCSKDLEVKISISKAVLGGTCFI